MNKHLQRSRQSGFAIVIALSILAFTLLLLLSLTAFVRVEQQASAISINQLTARQNALLAVQIAIGELQQHTGPDQRVTATAQVLSADEVTLSRAGDGEIQGFASVENFWNKQRNGHWTGVWKNGNGSTFDPDDPTEGNPIPQLQNWLVSGNEAFGGSLAQPEPDYLPTEQVSINANTTPWDNITDQTNTNIEHVLLAWLPEENGSGSLISSIDRMVTAPRVDISSSEGRISGSYAWWVGDEGVKARANLVDPYATLGTDESKLRRAASAQRTGIEAMTDLAPFYNANEPALENIFQASEFALLDPDPLYAEALTKRFHDLSFYSRGVLADVRNGGLKRDLSYILGQPNLNDLHNAVDAVFEPVDGESAINPADESNQVLKAVVTPYAEIPSNVPDWKYSIYDEPGLLAYTPTWERLWSFHNMGNQTSDSPAGVFNGFGQAVPQLISRIDHGIHPMVTQAKLFYNLTFAPTIQIQIIPLVVLANPYSVPLAPADYTIKFYDPTTQVRFGTPADPYDPQLNEFSGLERLGISIDDGGFGDSQVILRSDGMAPGEAQIFTIETSGRLIPQTASSQKDFEVVLINDFDPSAYVSYDTALAIPEEYTHAVVFHTKSDFKTKLYLDYDPGTASDDGDRKLLQDVAGWTSSADEDGRFVVYPADSGTNAGGGISYALFDYSISDYSIWIRVHALFYQQNYRTNVIDGFHGVTGQRHLLQWARTIAKKGAPGNENYIGADLLRESGSLTTVRWGPVNTGTGNYDTVAPPGLGDDVGFINWLYDIPQSEVPLASLGHLQHFNTSAFIDRDTWRTYSSTPSEYAIADKATTVQSWQVNYPISNSYPQPRVARDKLFDNYSPGAEYDGSYIWNTALWDRFYFSTFPATGDFDFATDRLVNARYQPFRSHSTTPLDDETQFRGGAGTSGEQKNSRLAAQNLLVEGGFNVNSTSKEAWKAVFASLRNVEIGDETDSANLSAPFVRTIQRLSRSPDAETGNHANAWNGFRNLNEDELDKLAEQMVLQVQLRGPFLSMADFVNRLLIEQGNDTFGLGLSGALQAAIDGAGINHDDLLDDLFDAKTSTDPNHLREGVDYQLPSFISGFPGYLLQADVLSSIGQYLTARSDTFRIRTYGDAINPVTSTIDARVWCEAIVQRLPDYVEAKNGSLGNEPHEDSSDQVNDRFGRRYQIVSIRWLPPEEI